MPAPETQGQGPWHKTAPVLSAAQRTARRTHLGPRLQEPSCAHRLESRADASPEPPGGTQTCQPRASPPDSQRDGQRDTQTVT